MATDEPLRIADFSPNCLMGACEAIARNRLGLDNLDRLFFNSSFVYARHPDGLGLDVAPVLNSSFSRALPLDKRTFLDRLEQCYGITLLHKGYEDFAELKADLATLSKHGLPVISELDFFFLSGHPFHGKVHDGHMMIVRGPGQEAGTLSVVEAVFGGSAFPINALAACFDDRIRRGRPFYLMHVQRAKGIDRWLRQEAVLADLTASLDNLTSDDPDQGIRGLMSFCTDIGAYLLRATEPFLVRGFWAFMCNAKNNLRFLAALDPQLRAAGGDARSALETHLAWLYKRWFLLNLTMENAVSDGSLDMLARLPSDLKAVAEREQRTSDLIAALVRALEAG